MIDWIGGILKGGSSIIKSVGDVVDEFNLSGEEKQQFKQKFEELQQKRDSEMEQTLRQELQTKERVLVAELTQGDNYTKRARPTVVYMGLFFIFFNYCAAPMMQTFLADTAIQAFDLPVGFWTAWGGIVGSWSIARSAERIGFRNRVTGAITGNNNNPSIFK